MINKFLFLMYMYMEISLSSVKRGQRIKYWCNVPFCRLFSKKIGGVSESKSSQEQHESFSNIHSVLQRILIQVPVSFSSLAKEGGSSLENDIPFFMAFVYHTEFQFLLERKSLASKEDRRHFEWALFMRKTSNLIHILFVWLYLT